MSTNLSSNKRFLSDRAKGENPADERRKLIELANELGQIINLGRGDPDLPTPRHIIKAAQEALAEGATHYTAWAGLPGLRKAISKKLAEENGISVNPDKEIIVTVGAQEAIFLAMMTLINPGDEVIVPEPRYTPYDSCIEIAGGKIVPVVARAENNFEITAEDVAEVITPKSKMLLIISPNNPTGAVISRGNLVKIAELAEREDLVVISDELYERLVFDGIQTTSVASLPRMFERTLTVNGFSKAYSMTGWRVGYLAGPGDIISPMLNLKYSVTICAPAVSQYAALAALEESQDCVKETVAVYQERRQAAMRWLDRLGWKYVAPGGSFYILPDVSKYEMKSFDLAVYLLKNARVFTFPGTAFGKAGEGYLRLSLLVSTKEINEAFERIEKALDRISITNS
ncbi:aspartate aminotransferase [Desulfocucumis palustris]|uniref:Aminotransferase n=1 Tax=Desulfocucumis palustris TaxID=1898651 RepID=A0A2L2XGH5_9FIRM|nr:pyridoxal phosphate-dependent aminotransferase [Desulfocucumis palustris]GBF33316.1 aspartate aminotransferase [Desulfocucumis palustris]